jgi:hypothetical protein
VESLMFARATSDTGGSRTSGSFAHSNGTTTVKRKTKIGKKNREAGLTDCFCRTRDARGKVAMERGNGKGL